jgi:transcriptional regulator with XRE-family HTH domain
VAAANVTRADIRADTTRVNANTTRVDIVDEVAPREAELFGAAVHALRLEAGLSLNQLARRAGVDPAYIHRIESVARTHTKPPNRPPLPRRAIVLSIAAALGMDRRQTDELLTQAGYAPAALLEMGGWDDTMASIAELLGDPELSGPAKAEFREVIRILAQHWGGPNRR